jgi:hypothetical protein
MAKNQKKYQQKTAANKTVSVSKTNRQKSESIKDIFLKTAFLAIIVFCAVYFTDTKQWFWADQRNNHTKRKWDWYYHFTKQNPVDIVLIGNSRLYTGINPKNLSTALGANCFILASPGTNITDSYFALKEAITVCKPKIAIIETHTIGNYVSHNIKKNGLSDQIKSFESRKKFWQKLVSTPVLFAPDNYLAAWSNTIRNHSFIFSDIEQIKRNMKTPPPPTRFDKLYLGRYVRFTSGIEANTLAKYDIPNAVKLENDSIGSEAKKYLGKIIDLCRKNDIVPIFVSVPVYYRHIQNYEPFKEEVEKLLKQYNTVWLDMQLPYDTAVFTPDCFENTTEINQHMTYTGSLVASYKLAHFINSNFADKLPNRKNETDWRTLFYADEGFFENNTPDKSNILAQNITFAGMPEIMEIDIFPQKDYNILYLKIARTQQIEPTSRVILNVTAKIGNSSAETQLIFQQNKCYNPIAHYLFMTTLRKDTSIEKILGMKIEN